MTPLRKACAALAGLALLGALGSAGSTVRVLSSTKPGTGTVTSREKVGFRSWAITVSYPSGDASETFETRGYYRGSAYGAGAEVPVRVGESTARLGSTQALWLWPVFLSLLGGLLWGVVSLTKTDERADEGPPPDAKGAQG